MCRRAGSSLKYSTVQGRVCRRAGSGAPPRCCRLWTEMAAERIQVTGEIQYCILNTLCFTHYTLHTKLCTLDLTHYTLHTILYTLYFTHYTLHTIHLTHYNLLTTFFTQFFTHYTLQTRQGIPIGSKSSLKLFCLPAWY